MFRGKSAAGEPPQLVIRTMRVPFDHQRPQDGSFPLQYALLRPFDHGKPTVVVVSDGQQFFVTPSAFASTTTPLFNESFNVVGVFGRGQSPSLQQRVGNGDSVDWVQAYRQLGASGRLGETIEAHACKRHLLISHRPQVYQKSTLNQSCPKNLSELV